MIYVDQLQWYGQDKGNWCHMVTDASLDELHRFAKHIGMKRSWFQDDSQYPHYDLTPNMRMKALRFGAKSVTSRELLKICKTSQLNS